MKHRPYLLFMMIVLNLLSNELKSQSEYRVDSLFSRSIIPNYNQEDSLYYEYDTDNRLIKERNRYFYKIVTHEDNTEIVRIYNNDDEELQAEIVDQISLSAGSGIRVRISNEYENGSVVRASYDTTFMNDFIPTFQVYWYDDGIAASRKIFELTTDYIGGNLIYSLHRSYDENLNVVIEELYQASYENDQLMWEASQRSSPFLPTTVDSTLYSYPSSEATEKTLKSYRDGLVTYCVKNKVVKNGGMEITNSYESHNCLSFTLQDSLVKYMSQYAFVDVDSLRAFRFIDDNASAYRFEDTEVIFDAEAQSVEVYRIGEFSNRTDGKITQIHSSNTYFSLSLPIETTPPPFAVDWNIYPNPALKSDEIHMEFDFVDSENTATMQIYNIQGALVRELGINHSIIKMPSLQNNGIYFIRVIDSKGTWSLTKKLIVD